MLVDSNGFLIYHPTTEAHYRHLIQAEPEIADDLIDADILRDFQCNDFAWKLEYNTWKLVMEEQQTRYGSFYNIAPIIDTNIFLIARDRRANAISAVCMSCKAGSYSGGSLTEECRRRDGCNCPCHSRLDYEPCTNTFNMEATQAHPVCTNATPQFMSCAEAPVLAPNDVTVPAQCFTVECTEYTNEYDCGFRVECSWCPLERGVQPTCNWRQNCPVTFPSGQSSKLKIFV